MANFKLTIIHGNEDVVEKDGFTSLPQAFAEAERLEDEKHGNIMPLPRRFRWSKTGPNWAQYGTDYHYVMLEEVDA